MRAEDVESVRQIPLFKEVGWDCLDAMLQAAFLQRFPPGVLLSRQAVRPDFLHVIFEGSVEIFATHGAAEATVMILRPYDLFPLSSVALDDHTINGARTLDASKVLMIPAERVRIALHQDSGLCHAVARSMAMEKQAIVRDLQSHKLRTSLQRLGAWILAEHRARGSGTAITIPFQKRTLASLIGTSPENLSRNFQSMHQYGVLVRGSRLIIEDFDALLELAQPAPELDYFQIPP